MISRVLIILAAVGLHSFAAECDGKNLEVISFSSRVFPTPRKLRVLLPEGYRNPENRQRKYPVLYLNDGQTLFADCAAGSESWNVDGTVPRLIRERLIPPLIVVGIDNGGRRLRAKEYLPYVDETLQPPEPNPHGKLYPRFLLNEVIPFVEQRFRIRQGAAHRVLGGASYGAGAALFAVIKRPQSFAGLLLESPSVYASEYQLLKDAKGISKWPKRIYVGTGDMNEPVDDVRKLEALLKQAGLDDERLRVVVQKGASHHERYWAERLESALKFLFAQE